jgi:hypothetical protein
MKFQRIEGKEERSILIGMIVSDQFLNWIAGKYEKEMLKSRWSNLVADWCIKHYQKFHKAPQAGIEQVYEKWSQKTKEKEVVDLIGSFLGSLSKSYKSYSKDIAVDTLIDQAADYFNKVKILKLRDELESAIDDGEVSKAKDLVSAFTHFEVSETEVIDPFQDSEVHKQTYNARAKPLLTYGGEIGKFFGDQFARENFLAFEGEEKAGKSFWLQDVCHRGAQARLRTAFFGIGDMSKTQTMQRYQARLCRRPNKKTKYKYPIELEFVDWETSRIRRKTLRTEKPLTFREIEHAREKFVRHHIRSDERYFKMLCQPNLSLIGIKGWLRKWFDQTGWKPDIIAIDYADLLDPPHGKHNKVEEVDENWRQMRFMALEHNCLMLTATQVRRSGYGRKWLSINDTADSKTKVAHVTGFIGINYNEPEWNTQRRRLNWIRIREITKRSHVHVAGCYAIANPCILSA